MNLKKWCFAGTRLLQKAVWAWWWAGLALAGTSTSVAAQSVVPAICESYNGSVCMHWVAQVDSQTYHDENGFAGWDAQTFHGALRSCIAGLEPLISFHLENTALTAG